MKNLGLDRALTSRIRVLTVALTGFVVVSCAETPLQFYEGPARSDDETVQIVVESRGDQVFIESIDRPMGEVVPVRTRNVRILPRETCLGVRVPGRVRGIVDVCFEPYAGRRYEVGLEPFADTNHNPNALARPRSASPGPAPGNNNPSAPRTRWRLSVIDTATGEPIASVDLD